MFTGTFIYTRQDEDRINAYFKLGLYCRSWAYILSVSCLLLQFQMHVYICSGSAIRPELNVYLRFLRKIRHLGHVNELRGELVSHDIAHSRESFFLRSVPVSSVCFSFERGGKRRAHFVFMPVLSVFTVPCIFFFAPCSPRHYI